MKAGSVTPLLLPARGDPVGSICMKFSRSFVKIGAADYCLLDRPLQKVGMLGASRAHMQLSPKVSGLWCCVMWWVSRFAAGPKGAEDDTRHPLRLWPGGRGNQSARDELLHYWNYQTDPAVGSDQSA